MRRSCPSADNSKAHTDIRTYTHTPMRAGPVRRLRVRRHFWGKTHSLTRCDLLNSLFSVSHILLHSLSRALTLVWLCCVVEGQFMRLQLQAESQAHTMRCDHHPAPSQSVPMRKTGKRRRENSAARAMCNKYLHTGGLPALVCVCLLYTGASREPR